MGHIRSDVAHTGIRASYLEDQYMSSGAHERNTLCQNIALSIEYKLNFLTKKKSNQKSSVADSCSWRVTATNNPGPKVLEGYSYPVPDDKN